MPKIIVVDASLTLSWVLKENNYEGQIKEVLDDITTGKIITVAPTIWLYETINGLKSAILSSRIKPKLQSQYLLKILELSPQLRDFTHLVFDSFQIATKFNLSVYDSSYIALAKVEKCDFFTGDEKLYTKVFKNLDFVKHVSEYSKV